MRQQAIAGDSAQYGVMAEVNGEIEGVLAAVCRAQGHSLLEGQNRVVRWRWEKKVRWLEVVRMARRASGVVKAVGMMAHFLKLRAKSAKSSAF